MNQVPTLTARVAAPPDTATPAYRPIPPYCVPEPFGEHLLALHYRLLRDVRPQVRDGGGVLTAIGGRVPDAVAFGLHRVCGYVPEFVASDVKLQSEARLIVPGYRQVEERHSGVQFRFYAAEAVPLVADAKRSGLEGQALADAVAPALRNLTLAARDADRHWRQGCQSPTRF